MEGTDERGLMKVLKEVSERMFELFANANKEKLDRALGSGRVGNIAEALGISESELQALMSQGSEAAKSIRVTIPAGAREGDACLIPDGGTLVLSQH